MPTLSVVGAYCGVEQFRRASGLQGSDRDAVILEHLLAASRDIERQTLRRYFPVIATDDYRWPPLHIAASWEVWTEDDLLSVSLLQVAAAGQNASPVSLTNYFLEPQQFGPPYNRIEVDLSSSDVFQSGPTPQRSVQITGAWGFCSTTLVAGTLAVAITDAAATLLVCSNASRIDQGDVLLIGSEAIYVDSPRTQVDTAATLSGDIDAQKSTQTVGLSDGTKVNTGETILIDAESMLVQSITGNNATVIRGWDGSTLAAHTSGAHVYAPRGLTIQRGVNGTTAATHLTNAPIAKYQAPANIRRIVRADAIGTFQQDQASWGRTVGAGDMAAEFQGKALKSFRKEVIDEFRRRRAAAI